MCESWRLVLRQGFLPQWSSDRLEKAVRMLEEDSAFITQGSTTTPPPLMSVQDWPLEACDIVAFCSIEDEVGITVGQAEEAFAEAVYVSDTVLGEPAASRWFLNTFDDTPRYEMWANLIEEFKRELTIRQGRAGAIAQLEPELQKALATFPDDEVLKGACIDALIERGLEVEAEALRK